MAGYIDISPILTLVQTLVPTIITLFVVMFMMRFLSSTFEKVTAAMA